MVLLWYLLVCGLVCQIEAHNMENRISFFKVIINWSCTCQHIIYGSCKLHKPITLCVTWCRLSKKYYCSYLFVADEVEDEAIVTLNGVTELLLRGKLDAEVRIPSHSHAAWTISCGGHYSGGSVRSRGGGGGSCTIKWQWCHQTAWAFSGHRTRRPNV